MKSTIQQIRIAFLAACLALLPMAYAVSPPPADWSHARADSLLLEQATFVVFDLETTGLRPGLARPCEFGAVRVERLEPTR